MIGLTNDQIIATARNVARSVIALMEQNNSITFVTEMERYLFEQGAVLGATQVIENLIYRNDPGFEWGKYLYEVIKDDEESGTR
jgi:hypothetical protein